ncbi:MAG: insulinase family protein [Candidatus Rokubacteria bacterium]|nr:insulinase family protein [Candidatus Rokubacteria bacterium]
MLVLVALLLSASSVPAASPKAHREVLPNGIVLIVSERPAVPIVVARVYSRAGAVLDPPGRGGLASLTGALLTRGTAKRTGPELDAAIEFVGGSVEAGAGRDGMAASLAVLTKDLTLGLDLLAEVVLTPAFPEAEFKRRAAEVQAGIKRSEESPETVGYRALGRLVYPTHPYGVPVEGTVESVGRLTRDDVVRFHREWVRPDTTIVAVVGAVTVADARREILARFGNWQRPSAPPPTIPRATPGPPPREDRIERDLTQATILFGRQAIRQVDPDYFPLTVASYILGGGSTGRLYSRVRDEGGLAYSVGSYVSPAKYGASAVVSSQTRVTEVKRVLDLLRDEMARIGRDPVSDQELTLAKSYLVGSFPLRLDTSRKVADFLVAVEEQGLGLDYADRYIERIRRVTAADVQRVAAKYFKPDTFNLVVVGTVK